MDGVIVTSVLVFCPFPGRFFLSKPTIPVPASCPIVIIVGGHTPPDYYTITHTRTLHTTYGYLHTRTHTQKLHSAHRFPFVRKYVLRPFSYRSQNLGWLVVCILSCTERHSAPFLISPLVLPENPIRVPAPAVGPPLTSILSLIRAITFFHHRHHWHTTLLRERERARERERDKKPCQIPLPTPARPHAHAHTPTCFYPSHLTTSQQRIRGGLWSRKPREHEREGVRQESTI